MVSMVPCSGGFPQGYGSASYGQGYQPMEKVPGRLEKVKAKVRAKIGVRGTVGMRQLVGHGRKWEQALQEQR